MLTDFSRRDQPQNPLTGIRVFIFRKFWTLSAIYLRSVSVLKSTVTQHFCGGNCDVSDTDFVNDRCLIAVSTTYFLSLLLCLRKRIRGFECWSFRGEAGSLEHFHKVFRFYAARAAARYNFRLITHTDHSGLCQCRLVEENQPEKVDHHSRLHELLRLPTCLPKGHLFTQVCFSIFSHLGFMAITYLRFMKVFLQFFESGGFRSHQGNRRRVKRNTPFPQVIVREFVFFLEGRQSREKRF